ncbi:HAD family hydrolase [Staphylococcus delphini]|uniref:HAD family hydrolase n=1 Tax=Staphylococcus delphini TaxID=53344 RepID=UPI0023B2E390|nr:HAD hydrolase family protein [Staphylococcus delphini]MDE9799719.1 HAD hydrolase family protein [Staphylococcus delphini]MDE9805490.1 HAD hydrolase family protein [Staphylococcus delphini]
MNLQFVVTDMDGTFLDSQSAFDREAFCRLKVRCEEKGIRFVFCTGKQCDRVVRILNGLEKDTYIVGDSATRIQYNGDNIWSQTFERELGLSLIQRLQQLLGCYQASTIAFGDGLNDVELFNAAGIKVVMDNAYPELKRKADLIAKDHNHNGVIHTLNVLLDLEA